MPYPTEIILYHEPGQSTRGISIKIVDFGKKSPAGSQKNLDSRGQWCYALAVKSVDREKYRPTSAQRARHSAASRDGDGAGKNTRELQTEPREAGSRGAAGRALQRQRFKGERVRKGTVCFVFHACGKLGGTADQAAIRPKFVWDECAAFFIARFQK